MEVYPIPPGDKVIIKNQIKNIKQLYQKGDQGNQGKRVST